MEIYSTTLEVIEHNKLVYIQFPHIKNHKEILHGFSTRLGGVSKGPYSELNLGLGSADDERAVRENYKNFSGLFELSLEDLCLSDQNHGTEVRVVTREDKGKGLTKTRDFKGVDGLITQETGLGLITHHADCVPLFFYDPISKAVGVAHAGWKGSVSEMAKVMVDKFANHFSTNPKNLIVGIGPSIGPCCYEVGEEVINEMKKKRKIVKDFYTITNKGRTHLDLWLLNKIQLIESGVPEKNIVTTDLCTKCNQGFFYSYRGQGKKRGTMGAFIAMK